MGKSSACARRNKNTEQSPDFRGQGVGWGFLGELGFDLRPGRGSKVANDGRREMGILPGKRGITNKAQERKTLTSETRNW